MAKTSLLVKTTLPTFFCVVYVILRSSKPFIFLLSLILSSVFLGLLKIKNITSPITKYNRNSPIAPAAKYENEEPVKFNLESGDVEIIKIRNEIII
jgi:hypothetical protein